MLIARGHASEMIRSQIKKLGYFSLSSEVANHIALCEEQPVLPGVTDKCFIQAKTETLKTQTPKSQESN